MRRKPREARHDPELAGAWFDEVWRLDRGRCRVCGSPANVLTAQVHHVIPKGYLWSHRWDFDDIQKVIWDPRNGMVVHNDTHDAHTLARQRIPRYCLPARALDFAREHGLTWKLEQDYPE